MRTLKLIKDGVPKCFRCDKRLRESMSGMGAWEGPSDAVCFLDGGNFGSGIYDSCYDGCRVEILVCDDCLTANRDAIREYETPGYIEERERRSQETVQDLLALGFGDEPESEAPHV